MKGENMAYFIVQVQTNYEKYVLCMLADILYKKNISVVKRIYALDTYVEYHPYLNNQDIREYLKQSRIRNYLNNIRYAYYQMNNEKHELKADYKAQIKELTKQANKHPSSKNKPKTLFIRGYIIIECIGEFEVIPSDLYHDIKSIPKVIAIPSTYSVPDEEIKHYFNQIKENKSLAT